ncbi:L,D-peptidoglycan transpeptidase YkuD (ErfK/YbiS/YcfS/YnhG family) [Palleronia aestuarii]|uniref:L,D-peptidoglycan transpeptidase YkuD (ErfK/YbiS/YcfS/YnhG family) n=1 Tax=Palleronia aestuarii TaxID=568105 RepID=A0A2W7NF67_9RHOB|nr:L,D-transpeptidase family protein [Palleronia aestuarii]PZX18848.1 L,D-peptidoglycan transpeptidase YkuD (ErfK/YbiS/YcfS/YnhG family) [Palleronia aestuarii]
MRPGRAVLTPSGLLVAGRCLPCTIGRGGVTLHKREGDGATPAGRLTVTDLLYRPDRMARPAPWARPIGPRDLWCDESDHADYNRPVRAPFAASHERLRRADPLYDLVIVTDWNAAPVRAGRGSAIFVHRWRRRGAPTEGCIALSAPDLRWLARRFPPGTPLVVPPRG